MYLSEPLLFQIMSVAAHSPMVLCCEGFVFSTASSQKPPERVHSCPHCPGSPPFLSGPRWAHLPDSLQTRRVFFPAFFRCCFSSHSCSGGRKDHREVSGITFMIFLSPADPAEQGLGDSLAIISNRPLHI